MSYMVPFMSSLYYTIIFLHPQINTIVKKPKFVHINIKVLSVCVALVFCILLFNTVLFTYKYYQCKSRGDEQSDIVEWAQILRSEERMANEKFDGRLPTSIKPFAYKIRILPFINENNFTFEGEVWIKVKVKSPTNNITIHINELGVLKYSIKQLVIDDGPSWMHKGRELKVDQMYNETRNQFLIFMLKDEQLLPPNKYELYIKYVGRLNNNMRGLYKSSYTSRENENVTR